MIESSYSIFIWVWHLFFFLMWHQGVFIIIFVPSNHFCFLFLSSYFFSLFAIGYRSHLYNTRVANLHVHWNTYVTYSFLYSSIDNEFQRMDRNGFFLSFKDKAMLRHDKIFGIIFVPKIQKHICSFLS